MSSFEGQWGLCMEEQEGCRKQTLLFKGTHKISHALRPSTEAVIWEEPGSGPLTDLGEASQRGRRDSPWGHWWQPFWELVLPLGHWCWQAPFWSPPSNYWCWEPALTTSGLTPAPGSLRAPSKSLKNQHHPPAGWEQLQDFQGTSPPHKWASTSIGIQVPSASRHGDCQHSPVDQEQHSLAV